MGLFNGVFVMWISPKFPSETPLLTVIWVFNFLIFLAPRDRQHPKILHAGVKKNPGCPPGTSVFFHVIANLLLEKLLIHWIHETISMPKLPKSSCTGVKEVEIPFWDTLKNII